MKLNIAIGKDNNGWFTRFETYFCILQKDYPQLRYEIIDLDSDEFEKEILDFDAILWNPGYMGLRLSGHLKEKIYFAEKYLGKLIFPSYDTVWHFESKIAQQLLFEHSKIRYPKTKISFNYLHAKKIINDINYPVVLKKSEGASSKNVKLIKNKKWLSIYIERVFCNQFWSEHRKYYSKPQMLTRFFTKRWFWSFIISQYLKTDDGIGVLYLQEFIPDNNADLRITIIGKKFAIAFWRNNRPGDFRASGSGLLDYRKKIPFDVLRYCQDISVKNNFDSMAYDILFINEEFYINEISYSYVDKAIYNTPGYYYLGENIEFIEDHTWPQALWVKAFIDKIQTKYS
jgi:glutathione synthase/RimK-type ligase-like ATP-grasp enzyme